MWSLHNICILLTKIPESFQLPPLWFCVSLLKLSMDTVYPLYPPFMVHEEHAQQHISGIWIEPNSSSYSQGHVSSVNPTEITESCNFRFKLTRVNSFNSLHQKISWMHVHTSKPGRKTIYSTGGGAFPVKIPLWSYFYILLSQQKKPHNT